jgi:hypothetical protein
VRARRRAHRRHATAAASKSVDSLLGPGRASRYLGWVLVLEALAGPHPAWLLALGTVTLGLRPVRAAGHAGVRTTRVAWTRGHRVRFAPALLAVILFLPLAAPGGDITCFPRDCWRRVRRETRGDPRAGRRGPQISRPPLASPVEPGNDRLAAEWAGRCPALGGNSRAGAWPRVPAMAARASAATRGHEELALPARGARRCNGNGAPEALADFERSPRSRTCSEATRPRGRYPLVALGTLAELERTECAAAAVPRGVAAVHARTSWRCVLAGAAGLVLDGRAPGPHAGAQPTRHDQRLALPLYTSFLGGRDRTIAGWGAVVSPDRGAALRARLAGGREARRSRWSSDCERLHGGVHSSSGARDRRAMLPGEVLITSQPVVPSRPGANDKRLGQRGDARVRDRGSCWPRSRTARVARRRRRTAAFPVDARVSPDTYSLGRPVTPEPAWRSTLVGGVNLRQCGGAAAGLAAARCSWSNAPHFLGTFADELLAPHPHRCTAQDWGA